MTRFRDALARVATVAMDQSRRIRAGTRDSERHYWAGRRFRSAAARWSDAQREMWTLSRLRETVRHAAETPFYRQRFEAAGLDPASDFTFDDFGRLPILERSEVSDSWRDMLSPRVSPADRRKDGTGGSTGAPLTYWSGPEERGWRASGQDDLQETLGLPRGSRMAYLWGHHIDQRDRSRWRDRLRDTLLNRHWFDCFRLSPPVLRTYHAELTRLRPTGLLAYASALDALATELIASGIKATYPTVRLLTGAEKLWPAQRARIEQAFDVPVHEQYGSREIGLVASQRGDPRVSLALDVDWASVLIEPETDAPDSAVIVTKLHGDAMPMMRYRLGDEARFPSGSRPGHPAWRLEEVLGRQLDGLHLPNGRWVHGVGIPHMMKDLPVREFQIVQDADYSVEVLVVPGADFSDADSVRIEQVLGTNLPGIPIRVTRTDAIPRSKAAKWRPVITHAVASVSPSHPSPTAS